MQAKLDLTADRAAALLLRQEAEALREKVAKGCTERDNLLAIHRKIQDFYDLAVCISLWAVHSLLFGKLHDVFMDRLMSHSILIIELF